MTVSPAARERLGLVALAALPLAVLVVFFLHPVAGMMARGLWPDGHLDLAGVGEVLRRPRTLRVLGFTVGSAGAATLVALVAGLPTAYVLHRLDFPGRGVLRAVVMVPFVLPTIVVAVAFQQVFGEAGVLAGLNLDGSSLVVVLALAFFNVSLVARGVGTFWESLDPRAEEAAAVLGAGPTRVFLTITLPRLLPAIASALSVVFLFCATSFGVVLALGGLAHANVETEIYLLTTQELDLTGAAALSLLQLALISGLLLVVAAVRRRQVAVDRSRAARRPTRRDLPVVLVAVVVVAALLFPMVSLVTASLRVDDGWGLDHYSTLFHVGEDVPVSAMHALGHSLRIALLAATFALVLGLLVSHVVSRRTTDAVGRRVVTAFDALFMLPLGVSAVTLGFGFLITLDKPPLDLRSSPLLIPIAQALVALPLVVRTVAPVWRSIDQRQREAAASLGAGSWRVFRDVDLAVGRRAIGAALAFAFAVSLGEFGATSFLSRDDDPTLPVMIYRLLGLPGADNFGAAMAASVVLATTTAVVMVVVERLRGGAAGDI